VRQALCASGDIVIPIKYEEIEFAFEFVSFDPFGDNQVYICRDTGKIYCDSDAIDEELPDDLYENDKYLAPPTKQELGLGKPLALRFTAWQLPKDYDTVHRFFSSRGAYSRFKLLLEERGTLEEWYEYEQSAIRQALLSWCEENGLSVSI
jgi:hypothetical protein